MDHRLIALQFFKLPKVTNSDLGISNSATDLSAGDIIYSILLKFIDVMEGVGVIIVGILAMRIMKAYLQRIQTTHERQKTAINLLEKITSGFIIVISMTMGLKVMGLDLTLIVSVILLGVSFGLRDVIKNYVAGLQILLKSPFEIGDVVQIRSYIGKVEKIEFQSTTLRTFDNKLVTIQNRDLLIQTLTNFSKADKTRLEISIPMSTPADLHGALTAFQVVLDKNPAVLKSPKYSIVFKTFISKSANIVVRFWVQKPCNEIKIRSELALDLQTALTNMPEKAPMEIAPATNGAAPMNGEVATVPVEEYVDIEEPA